MNEFTTVFKFVGAGNGGESGSATSSVATGDITMLIAGIVALLIGAFAIWATVTYRKRVTAGAHAANGNKMYAPFIAAIVAIMLGLGLTLASTSRIKAHAEGAITTTDCIGTVDEQTGSVTFSDITMTNNSKDTQLINDFNFIAAEGVTGLNDVVWTLEAETIYGEETLFKGKFGDPVEEGWLPLPMDAGFTSIISVSATGISPEVAKSLIGKDVAYETSIYDALYTVSASVDDDTHGSITYSTESSVGLDLPNGVTYAVDKDNANIITFGTGEHAQTITFTPAEGYKLTNWTLNGDVITEGTVNGSLEFVANTETATSYYTGTIQAIDEAGGTAVGKDGITVQFTPSGSTNEVVTATTENGGKYVLTGVVAGTAGELKIISGPSGASYSAEPTTIAQGSAGQLNTITTRKLTSLAVTVNSGVYDESTGEYKDTKLSTVWCPAFLASGTGSLTKNTIIFYDSNKCEIDGTAVSGSTETYQMSDLYTGATKDPKNIGLYFAFKATDQILKCYQVTDSCCKDTFKFPEKKSAPSTGLQDNWNLDNKYCSEDGVNTVYFNGTEKEKEDWTTEKFSDIPTLNGIQYATADEGKLNGGWYLAYGTNKGNLLTSQSSICYSSYLTYDDDWDSFNGHSFRISYADWVLVYDVDTCEDEYGVVLSKDFTS